MTITPKWSRMKTRNFFYVLLIVFNLICLYFIFELFSYDQIMYFLQDGGDKLITPRNLALIFFSNCMANLLLIVVALMPNLNFGSKR